MALGDGEEVVAHRAHHAAGVVVGEHDRLGVLPVSLPAAPTGTPALPRPPRAVYVAALASHEVWWDGTLIGRGGVVGAMPASEVPGPVEAWYGIPDSLSAPCRVPVGRTFRRGTIARLGGIR